jgi:hypothetical protein
MPQPRKSSRTARREPSNEARPGRGQAGKSDRWPSDYGRRQEQEKEDKAVHGGRSKNKPTKALENVDEQGERANVRQNTPPKGLRSKR